MHPTLASSPSASPSLTNALFLGEADLKRVDALILERVSGEIPLIKNITQHIVASGGKRLRPLLTLLCAQACGYVGARHIPLAASVEFIHTATLLHDDVVDESVLRRGLATANDVFGNKASVLVGDFLLAQAFQLMVADGSLSVLKILSDAAATISQGEVKQLMAEGQPDVSIDTYMDVISCKTAALFAAACEVGAAAADAKQYEAPLRAFGQSVGIAFQLVDDALDYASDSATLGKTVGDDFREGKVTLPVIFAWNAGTEEERAFWRRTMENRDQHEGDLAQAATILHNHQCITNTFAIAREWCGTAHAALISLPESPAKNALREIVDFCAGRMY